MDVSMLTVRDLDPEVKARLRERAARGGRSMEAEVRQILTRAVEADHEQPSIADCIVGAFAGIDVEIDLPERSQAAQRPIDL